MKKKPHNTDTLEIGRARLPRDISTADAVETLIDAHRVVQRRLATLGYVRLRYEERLENAGIVLNSRFTQS
jgi:hypothetical protein